MRRRTRPASGRMGRSEMDDKHNELVGYCMDYPEEAAREIARLRNIETAARDLVEKFDVLVGALTIDDPARRVDGSIDPYLS